MSHIKLLFKALKNNCLPHAIIFWGKDLRVNFELAIKLATAHFCANSKLDFTCDICEHCIKSKNSSHPNIILLEPDAYSERVQSTKKRSENIRIDQIRKLIQEQNTTNFEAGSRFFILPAEKLTVQAANALLKVLEEPKPNQYFFLVAKSPNNLLRTLNSRCQKIFCSQPQPHVSTDITSEQNTTWEGLRTASLSLSPEKLLSTVKLEDLREALPGVIQYLQSMIKNSVVDKTELFNQLNCLKNSLEYAAANTNPKLILDKLLLDLNRASLK